MTRSITVRNTILTTSGHIRRGVWIYTTLCASCLGIRCHYGVAFILGLKMSGFLKIHFCIVNCVPHPLKARFDLRVVAIAMVMKKVLLDRLVILGYAAACACLIGWVVAVPIWWGRYPAELVQSRRGSRRIGVGSEGRKGPWAVAGSPAARSLVEGARAGEALT
jgi:hypothetical protein